MIVAINGGELLVDISGLDISSSAISAGVLGSAGDSGHKVVSAGVSSCSVSGSCGDSSLVLTSSMVLTARLVLAARLVLGAGMVLAATGLVG